MSKLQVPQLKTNFDLLKSFESFYTGGKVQVVEDVIFCTCGDTVNAINSTTGERQYSLKDNERKTVVELGVEVSKDLCSDRKSSKNKENTKQFRKEIINGQDGDEITCFVVSPDGKVLVTATKALLLHCFDLEKKELIKKWKVSHKTPVLSMTFDKTSTLLATGSSDTTIKIYDLDKQYYTHSFKGSEESVSLLHFHPSQDKMHLFSSSSNGKIRLWDLKTSKCVSVFEGHFSEVTSIIFSTDHSLMISSGRDKVFIVWDLSKRIQIKTMPVFEVVESLYLLPRGHKLTNVNMNENLDYFISAGEEEVFKTWSLPDCKCVYMNGKPEKKNEESDERNPSTLTQLQYCEKENKFMAVTLDQNLLFFEPDTFRIGKQLIGHYDDILDVQLFGQSEEFVAVATNSHQIKVIDLESSASNILRGHTSTVLSIDVSHDGKYIASCSKDNTIRVWCVNEETSKFCCIAVGVGHTHDVGAVAWSRVSSDFLVTGSQDLTVKCWTLPKLLIRTEAVELNVKWTDKCHEKDINTIAISPNDNLLVSASQDKTAKVRKLHTGELIGVLRGHKRGVWYAAFSPVDRCIATASADSTIKIWALSDYTCVKTFEGHMNSVLKVKFISKGTQLISSGSDGLIKLWDIKHNECNATIEAHGEKTWALTVAKSEEFLISGGEDSTIKIWKDVTETLRLEEESKENERLQTEQELQNLIKGKKYRKAIRLAIQLKQPFRALTMFKDILMQSDGHSKIVDLIGDLRDYQLETLLGFMCDWNTNAKHSFVSQTVLSIILKTKSPDELLGFSSIKEIIEALLPYTERHYDRMNNLVQQSHFVNYTWESMKLSSQNS